MMCYILYLIFAVFCVCDAVSTTLRTKDMPNVSSENKSNDFLLSPNIVIFMVNDLGYEFLGKNEKYPSITPTLDNLRLHGIVLENSADLSQFKRSEEANGEVELKSENIVSRSEMQNKGYHTISLGDSWDLPQSNLRFNLNQDINCNSKYKSIPKLGNNLILDMVCTPDDGATGDLDEEDGDVDGLMSDDTNIRDTEDDQSGNNGMRSWMDTFSDIAISQLKASTIGMNPFILSLRPNNRYEQNQYLQLHQVDQCVDTLVTYLKSSGQWDKTILVLLSDEHDMHDNVINEENSTSRKNQHFPSFIYGGDLANELLKMKLDLPSVTITHVQRFISAIARNQFLKTNVRSLSTSINEESIIAELSPHQARNRHLLTPFQVLTLLYESTNGSQWTRKQNWLKGLPCLESWHGVTCSSDNVVSVALSSNNLRGSIPSQLGELVSLTSFSIAANTLSGFIPSELGQLLNLASFDFSTNRFNGSLPSQLGRFTALTSLFYIHANEFSGSLPSQLGQLSKMTANIYCYSNSFSGLLPSQLGLLSLLTSSFQIQANEFSGTLPSQIGQLTAMMSSFYISTNSFIGVLPSQLGMLVNMESNFQVNFNSFSGSLPSQLGQLTAMTSNFQVSSNGFSSFLPSQLGQLTALTSMFYIHANEFNGPLPSQLGQLAAITSLFYIHANEFNGSLPSQLGQLSKMSSNLYCYSNSFNGVLPSQLGQLSLLTSSFQMQGNKFSGPLPSQIGQLTAMMSSFYISANSFSGTLPSQLGQLTVMTSNFQVSSNSFSGSIPSQLGRLNQMTSTFDLSNNLLCDNVPTQVAALSALVSSYDVTTGNSLGTLCCVISETCSAAFYTLSTLYGMTLGESWTSQTNWLSREPCPSGSWYGVSCSSDNVVSVALSSNNLRGSIPSQLGELVSLTSFSIAANTLSGFIPSELGQLLNLTSFDISTNSFIGVLPSQFGLLVKMESNFQVNFNSFSGSLPSQLGQLTAMTSNFQVSSNGFSSFLPSQLGQLTALASFLSLDSNSFSGPLPSQLGQLTAISSSLSLHTNGFSGVLPSQFGLLTVMNSNFYIHDNDFGGPLPSELGQLTALFSLLYIHSNRFSGPLPSQMGQLTAMSSYLSIYSNSFNGSLPSQLGQLSKMTANLYCYSNSFSGLLPSQLGKLSLLTSSFQIHDNKFSGPLPSQLGEFTAMKLLFEASSNSFSGSIPSQLGRLNQMTSTFDLSNNLLCDNVPTQVAALSALMSSYDVTTGNSLGTLCCVISETCSAAFYALSTLYGMTLGESWTSQTNWLSREPCPSGSWYGVSCSSSDNVVSVVLSLNNLRGSIPSQLGELVSLTSFSIAANTLSGFIPSELGQLLNLTSFDISTNSFNGSLPSQLGQLSKLSSNLYCYSNSFSGLLPSQLGQLSLLTSAFQMHVNKFSGPLPSQIGQLTSLTSLFYLHVNSFSGSLPSQLGQLTAMESDFYIHDNEFSGPLPSQMGQLIAMSSYLSIYSNSFNGSLPSQLGQLSKMTANVLCYSNSFSGVLPSQLGQLSLLTSAFQMHVNKFSGPLPSQIGQLTSLTSLLFLPVNSFSGSLPSQLGQLTAMESGFQISSNGFSGFLPSQLGQLTALTSLFYIHANEFSGSLPSQLGQLIAMKSSFFIYSNNFNGSMPSQLGQLSKMTSNIHCFSNSFSGLLPSQLGLLSLLTSSFQMHVNKFSGPLPSQIGQLTSLTSLFYLPVNSFSGSLPSQLGQLTAMEAGFQISSNGFSGFLPSQLGQLTALTSLFYIHANEFSGSLPSQLGQLIAMKSSFFIYSNSFSGTLPSQLGQLTVMTSNFQVSSNSFSGSIPSQLGRLNQMTSTFDLSNNLLCDDVPTQVAALSALVSSYDVTTGNSLGTLCCVISETCSAEFYTLSTLYHEIGGLEWHNKMNWLSREPCPSGLWYGVTCSYGNLSLFNLESNNLKGSIPSQLGELSLLTSLLLESNSLSGSIPSELGLLTNINSYFELSSNFLCDNVPSQVSSLSSLALLRYNITASNSLGTLCCIAYPANHTCVPTTVPTPTPSLGPSTTTGTPSIVPSQLPTSPPSYIPTLSPTSLPSNVPTFYCPSGKYIEGSSCVQCDIGSYSNIEHAPFATSCELCPAGQYSVEVGASTCVACAIGKISSVDRTFCSDCDAGQYNSNNTECVNCEYGKYAPQALTGSCLECGNGSHTNNYTHATTCTACDGGKYARELSVECSICPKGKFSTSSASHCTDCNVGSYSSEDGSSNCIACSAGNYSALTGSTTCTSCPKGTYQGSTGQSYCQSCEPGKKALVKSSLICSDCATGYNSLEGSESCDFSSNDYYLAYPIDSLNSKACPNHAKCDGGYQLPVPLDGYWVDRSKYEYAGIIHKCSLETCVNNENSSASACWDAKAQFLNKSNIEIDCNSDDLQCRQGAGGALCGSCLDGYVLESVSKTCQQCGQIQATAYIIVGSFLVVGLVIVAYFQAGDYFGCLQWESVAYLLSFERGSLKVLWVTYQIVVSSASTIGVEFPSPFSSMLSILSIVSFDFLALKCFSNGSAAYYVTVYLWCLIPLVISLMIILVGVIRVYVYQQNHHHHHFSSITRVKNQHIWMILLLSYLVLPPVSNKQLQVFDCIQISNKYYLRADTSIDCESDRYLAFRGFVLLFIGIYQLIPISWMYLLYQKKEALNPNTSSYDTRLAMYIRDNNDELASLRFLFVDYKCDKWWFEITDMYRRIIFIGIVPLVSPNPATRASFGCMLAILSVAYYREEQPYRIEFTNVIAHIAQFCILITLYGALTIETSSMMNFGLQNQKLGIFLLVLNIIIAILAFWLAFHSYHKTSTQKKLKESKASYHEDAKSFSDIKFNTTFEAIWHHSVPCSHTLVFYYTSYEQAISARKSGIVAQRRFHGIPLTLRQPFSATKVDFDIFDNNSHQKNKVIYKNSVSDIQININSNEKRDFPNEEVLVLSLPKQFLDPLPGYEEDDGLCMISTEILSAMRSTSFTAVVDSSPWLNGTLMLPPHCILRSFLIMEPTSKSSKSQTNSTSYSKRHLALSKTIYSSSSLNNNRALSSSNSMSDFNTNSSNLQQQSLRQNSVGLHDYGVVVEDIPISSFISSLQVIHLTSIDVYLKPMSQLRQKAFNQSLVLLYHYTSLNVANLILQSGLRMSTQGQGDGGVYVSTQGPASYGLGTDDYEINIIKDCFGIERIEEYEGKGKLDVVIVYACEPSVLQQAPGGRDHAKMISKATFIDFSLQHSDGNYFLRPDRILGVFNINQTIQSMSHSIDAINELKIERNREHQVYEKLNKAEKRHQNNALRIENAIERLWSSFEELKLRTTSSSNVNHIPSKLSSTTSNLKNTQLSHQQETSSQSSSVEMVRFTTGDHLQQDDDEESGTNPLTTFDNEPQSYL